MDPVKEKLVKYRSKIIIVMSLLFILLGLGNLLVITTINPTSNDECLWIPEMKADTLAVRFESVKVNGVTWNAGIRNDDFLLKINGNKITSTNQAQMLLNKIAGGNYAKYTVKKSSGKILETKVYVKKLINFPALGASLLGFFWLLIAFIVLMAKPEGRIQRIFYAIGATMILLVAGNFQTFPFVKSTPPLGFIIDLLNTGGLVYLPFLLLHFFWIFPREFNFVKKKSINLLLYLVPAVIFIATIIYRLLFVYDSPLSSMYIEQHIEQYNKIENIFLGLAFLTGFISLNINYFRIKTPKERKPLSIILISYLLAILVILYTFFVAPAISDTIFNSPEFYMPVIILFILPVAFGYSIFRYQLMDVSIVVKNTIIYGAATITIAAVYFLVIYIIGQSVSTAIGTEYKGLIAGIIFIAFALIFQSTKDKFQEFLTAKFYPEQFAYQKILVRFSNEVTTVVGLENILDTMTSTFVESLKIKTFGIMLYDEQENEYRLARGVNLSSSEMKVSALNMRKVINEKYNTAGIPVIEEEDFSRALTVNPSFLIDEGIYTIIPMIIKQKVIGLMLLGLKHSGAKFAGKDLDLLNAVANQSAIAVENARLYKSEAEKIKIERDLDLARKIQQGLLPKKIPAIKGLDISGEMIPAMQVGGDYFDLIPVGEDKLFVIVGDVSGKGLSASLYMTKLQTMVESACLPGRLPKEILIDINKRIYTSMERSWFITMTVALFDMQNNKVNFCRAGHMPVFAVQDGTISKYRTMGLGVGLEKGIIFEKTLCEEEVSLSKNQVFAFFSDGVTEAMNEQKELFGEETLSRLLLNKSSFCSLEILKDIWKTIHNFRGQAEVNDDMTMVLVKVV
ncbi:MAG TPA: SpoIIE family protein phosphatase [Ignavibacteriaceae bacterium]|nr:SpoIIE family protein phosphatase [Ignavibacteriaceae bacterium]